MLKTVMIVDDEPGVIKGLCDHVPWAELGLTVAKTAGDGAEAFAHIRAQQPDIVITDVYMPKMDGLTLIQQLHEAYPHIQVVIHSGYDEFDNARLAMRYGVQHFLLKPATMGDIATVLQACKQDIIVHEKQQSLLSRFEEQQHDYMQYSKDALLREMLVTRYQSSNMLTEKLALLHLTGEEMVLAASLQLMRPPYLTKSKEREWQLMKFGSGNIIEEMIQASEGIEGITSHAIDYSDSTFVIVLFAKRAELDLEAISKQMMSKMIEHILLYMKLSLSVGIGSVKHGVHELINSYLESQHALEAVDFLGMNQVFTFKEVHGTQPTRGYHYPFDILREIYSAIHNRESERIKAIWQQFEQEHLASNTLPLFVTQNICISLLGVLMTDHVSGQALQEQMQDMTTWITDIQNKRSNDELCVWMRQRIDDWLTCERAAHSGSKSHVLIQKLKEYVRNHYDEEVTLTEIAESLYVNRNYLSQLFKRMTGETFVAYLNKYRIEKAKERMRENHYLISEISEMVGYQNPTYFSHVFKSITGKSPSEFYK